MQIAETFGKRRDNALADIKNLDCSKQFRLLNFQESSYKNEQKKKQPMFLMTKDGFIFLVFGYRGRKAAAFKEEYINRFNQMESFIKSLLATRIELHPALMDAIKESHAEPKAYHYSNEENMIYRIVLGMDAKKYKEEVIKSENRNMEQS